jgi:CopG family transcriptional regulator/antitoxin EndoAI
MAEVKKVLITLPESLLSEVDYLASLDNKNRSEFIREAMQHYLDERRQSELRTQMVQGYSEMADINRKISEEWLETENEVSILQDE